MSRQASLCTVLTPLCVVQHQLLETLKQESLVKDSTGAYGTYSLLLSRSCLTLSHCRTPCVGPTVRGRAGLRHD